MSDKRQKFQYEETDYWLSYSDMMAALLLIFVLIISFTMLDSQKNYEAQQLEIEQQKQEIQEKEKLVKQQQKQLDKIIGIRSELVEALREEFENTDLKVTVDKQTGAITFDSNVLFDYNRYSLKDSGKQFLKKFFPRYFKVLLNDRFSSYIGDIMIEGHTDTDGNYMFNLELSQKRALEVSKYCLSDNNGILSQKETEYLRKIVTANGRSFSDPVYQKNGKVDMAKSRRVEFKFRLKDEEMIDAMVTELAKTDS